MFWFSGINSHDKKKYYDYITMYTVAVLSAKKTNPNIKPYLLLDGKIDEEIQELIDLGVNVIETKSSIYNELKNHYKNNTIAFGAFLRIDIPKICENLKIEDEYVLYTDNDVMFLDDVSELINLKPKYFLAAGEFVKNFNPTLINTGVMWINWKSMRKLYDDFVFFIKLNFHRFKTYDQDAIRIFFKDKVEELSYLYNYKPYWGNQDGIKILHFHGPKPTFTDNDYKTYKYQKMATPFYYDMVKKFNEIYDDDNLFNT